MKLYLLSHNELAKHEYKLQRPNLILTLIQIKFITANREVISTNEK